MTTRLTTAQMMSGRTFIALPCLSIAVDILPLGRFRAVSNIVTEVPPELIARTTLCAWQWENADGGPTGVDVDRNAGFAAQGGTPVLPEIEPPVRRDAV
jgi:hypothetical protein